jgi:hypothetical protein
LFVSFVFGLTLANKRDETIATASLRGVTQMIENLDSIHESLK